MADYRKTKRNGIEYYYVTKTVGAEENEKGKLIPKKKTFYGKTKKALEEKVSEYEERVRRGMPERDSYFNVLSNEWIEKFFMVDGTIKDSTKATYIRAWRKYVVDAEFYSSKLNLITAATLQEFYVNLINSGVKRSHVVKINKIMRRFYTYVSVEGYGRNITTSVKVPKENKEPTCHEISTWTDDELSKILNCLDQAHAGFRLRFFIILAIFTGARFGELLGLRYSDFQGDGLHIRRQLQEEYTYDADGNDEYAPKIEKVKTDSSARVIPLNDLVWEELRRHKKWQLEEMLKKKYRVEKGYLFTTNSGAFYDKRNVRRALKRYYEEIEVKNKSVHSYRATFATNLCKSGVSIEVASKLLGHADISTTARYYVGITEERKKDAAKKLFDTITSMKPEENQQKVNKKAIS